MTELVEGLEGAEGDWVRAAHDANPAPGIESLVRRRFNLPAEWQGIIFKRLGYTPENQGGVGLQVEGGVCPPKARGRYKGSPNWSKATNKITFSASWADLEQHTREWEAETGLCAKCRNTGWKWAGWNHERGTRYTRCSCAKAEPNPAGGGE